MFTASGRIIAGAPINNQLRVRIGCPPTPKLSAGNIDTPRQFELRSRFRQALFLIIPIFIDAYWRFYLNFNHTPSFGQYFIIYTDHFKIGHATSFGEYSVIFTEKFCHLRVFKHRVQMEFVVCHQTTCYYFLYAMALNDRNSIEWHWSNPA